MSDIEKVLPEEGATTAESEANLPPPAEAEEELPQTDVEMPAKKTPRRRSRKAADESQTQSGAAADSQTAASPEGNPKPEPAEPSDDGRVRVRQRVAPDRADTNIVTIDSRVSVETDEARAADKLLDLIESLKTGRYLTDKIQGVERPSPDMEPRAILFHGDFKVIIPASEVFPLPGNLNDRNPVDVQYNMLNLRLGAEIDYVVKGLDGENGIAVGSRLDAMRTRRRYNYLQLAQDGTYRIYEGADCEARVMAVIPSGIFVEVMGVETFIPLAEISYTRIETAVGMYHQGDRVLVRITELDRDDPNHIKIRASIKRTAPDPRAKSMEKVVVHSNYSGKVTLLAEFGVFVTLDIGVDCLCQYPMRGRPVPGAQVTVHVDGKDNERSQIWGSIIYIGSAR